MKFLVALALVPALARADALSDGEALAKKGKFDEALAKLREADAEHPTAKIACLIGLAHLRSGHAPEAEERFAQCRARGEPPDWLPGVEDELAPQLAKLAPVSLEDYDGPYTLDGWRDEPFHAKHVHLPPGRYHVSAGAPKADFVVDGAAPVTVHLSVPETRPWLVQGAITPVHPRPTTRTSTYVLGAGVGLALVGAIVHVGLLAPSRSTLDNDVDGAQYDRDYPAFNNARIATIALYAGAAIALGVGLYLRAGERVVITPTQIAVRW